MCGGACIQKDIISARCCVFLFVSGHLLWLDSCSVCTRVQPLTRIVMHPVSACTCGKPILSSSLSTPLTPSPSHSSLSRPGTPWSHSKPPWSHSECHDTHHDSTHTRRSRTHSHQHSCAVRTQYFDSSLQRPASSQTHMHCNHQQVNPRLVQHCNSRLRSEATRSPCSQQLEKPPQWRAPQQANRATCKQEALNISKDVLHLQEKGNRFAPGRNGPLIKPLNLHKTASIACCTRS